MGLGKVKDTCDGQGAIVQRIPLILDENVCRAGCGPSMGHGETP